VHKDKNGSWYVHVWYHDFSGARKRKLKRGFKTRREAQAWEREFILQKTDDLDMTFETFVNVYAEDRKPRLKLNTWLSKEYVIKNKILPYFGKKKINEITSKDIIKWQNTLINHGDEEDKPYSQTYLKSIHNQLTAIFTHACKFYGLRVNPSSKAGSMGKKNAKEMLFWTRKEYARFADIAIDDPRVYYAYEMLYWCGIRVGELLALTYGDFDFEKKTVRINKSYQYLQGQAYVTEPKTPKSNRNILMPDFLCEEIREYMSLQYGYQPDDRLFLTSKTSLGKYIKIYAAEAGIKPIRVHDLRHSHVSLLIELGFSPVAIAARLGHESIEITLHYAHLFPTKQDEMAQALNEQGALCLA
jgi:integrase